MPRIEVAGDICLRRPRPTQGYTADDDDNLVLPDECALFILYYLALVVVLSFTFPVTSSL